MGGQGKMAAAGGAGANEVKGEVDGAAVNVNNGTEI